MMTYHHSNGEATLSGKPRCKHFLTFPLTWTYNFVIWQHKFIKYDSIDSMIFEEYNDIIKKLLKHL